MKDMKEIKRQKAELFFDRLFGGSHHFPSSIREYKSGWAISSNRSMSTYDYDNLTKAVVLAHDLCLRFELKPFGMERMLLIVSERKREGDMYERHPYLEDHIKSIRDKINLPNAINFTDPPPNLT